MWRRVKSCVEPELGDGASGTLDGRTAKLGNSESWDAGGCCAVAAGVAERARKDSRKLVVVLIPEGHLDFLLSRELISEGKYP